MNYTDLIKVRKILKRNLLGSMSIEENKWAIEKITDELHEMCKSVDESKRSIGKYFGLGLLIFTVGIMLVFIYSIFMN
jgi:uncharacterized membrane protein YukC